MKPIDRRYKEVLEKRKTERKEIADKVKEEQEEREESIRRSLQGKAGSLSAKRLKKSLKDGKGSPSKNEFSIEDLDIYARSIVWLKKKDKINEDEQVYKKLKAIEMNGAEMEHFSVHKQRSSLEAVGYIDSSKQPPKTS